jgi:hypothetical protein
MRHSALGLSALLIVGVAILVGVARGGQPPATVSARGPYPSLGSCPVFPSPPASLPPRAPSLPNQAAWNQDVSKAPVAPNSAAILAYIDAHGGDRLHPDFGSPRAYGFPYAVVGARQRKLPIHYTAYGGESDQGPFPVPAGAPVEGGQRSGGDRHVLVVDHSSCVLYELYRAFFERGGHAHWNADSGVSWNLRSTALRPDSWTSADAAGLPIFPGLVRYDEVASGHIDHALRFTVSRSQRAYLHPATHWASSSTDPDLPPMGLRFRLKASFDVSGYTGEARVVLNALKEYGMIVADNGSNWFISGAQDPRWNDDDLNQLKSVPGSAFEVVDTGEALHR